MAENPKPETTGYIVQCLTWYYSDGEASLPELEQFIRSISVGEPDQALVQEIYSKYKESIHTTGAELEKKLREK